METDIGIEEHCDGWWVTVGEDHEYAGPFPSQDDATYAAARVADTLFWPVAG